MKQKPIIGIAGDVITVNFEPVVGFQYEYTRNNYATALVKAGGVPCYLPVVDEKTVIKEQINMVDGLMIAGGEDVNPLFYKKQPLPLLKTTIPRVDRYQIELIIEAIRQRKPILGSCRGNQILNVALGGSLFQDESYAVPNPLQHSQLTQLDKVAHTVYIKPYTALYQLFGSVHSVNTFHHQSINKLGKGLKITAVAPDGVIEGVQAYGDLFIVGVQWHPEMILEGRHSMLPLFNAFVKEAC